MVKQFNTAEYEFAIRETRTRTVIEDVSTLRSEIGILYLSDFNRRAITKLLKTNELEFHKLIDCRVVGLDGTRVFVGGKNLLGKIERAVSALFERKTGICI